MWFKYEDQRLLILRLDRLKSILGFILLNVSKVCLDNWSLGLRYFSAKRQKWM